MCNKITGNLKHYGIDEMCKKITEMRDASWVIWNVKQNNLMHFMECVTK